MQKASENSYSFILECMERAKEEKKKQSENTSWDAIDQLTKATYALGVFQVTLIILFATVGGSQLLDPSTAPGTGTQGYNMFIGVEVMMFVGFGYLMTFLKWYGLGAIGLTAMVTAIGLQWALFTESFFDQLYNNTQADHWHLVHINIYSLLNALYAISAVLISFGAVIGKISPYQLVVMAVIELGCHSFNYKILMSGVVNLVDLGGTYIDHMFGAYFGLSVAYMLGRPTKDPEMGNIPDIFSLIGTAFLWIYWPSFVAGAAQADSDQQQRAIVNTIMALSSSTVATFWLTSLLSKNGRMRPVDIQNATLAGGVAIGCTANLTTSVFGAIMIGIFAGLVSTAGYNILQPWLEINLGLHDTCGIHNLHAMPSVIGAFASVILAGYKGDDYRHHDSAIYGQNSDSQWWRQLVGIVLCITFAITAGLTVGWLLRKITSNEEGGVTPFHDSSYWEVAEDYGRSLYSELAAMLPEGKGKDDVSELLQDWSTHQGRRNISVNGNNENRSIENSMNLSRHQANPTLSQIISDLSSHGIGLSAGSSTTPKHSDASKVSASQILDKLEKGEESGTAS